MIRREIVRKIGIERLCRDLDARCIDSLGDYELLALDIGDIWEYKYLRMRNPTTGERHIEGVDPDCANVREALAWRNQTTAMPQEMA